MYSQPACPESEASGRLDSTQREQWVVGYLEWCRVLHSMLLSLHLAFLVLKEQVDIYIENHFKYTNPQLTFFKEAHSRKAPFSLFILH